MPRRASRWLRRMLPVCVAAFATLAAAPACAAQRADLSIALARSGVFRPGSFVTYRVTVTNHGPDKAQGPIVVGGTIEAGLSLDAIEGAGWSCTQSGDLGSCSHGGMLAPNTEAPVLTLRVKVLTAGEKTVTATVRGRNDDNPGNNTVQNPATPPPVTNPQPDPAAVAAYALTDKACAPGVKIGADASACQYYTGAVVAGRVASIHVTAIDSSATARAAPAATVKMQFALRCINPAASAGTEASFGGARVPACAPKNEAPLVDTRWSPVIDVAFAGAAASAALAFRYPDVGLVSLHLKQGATPGTPAEFVSKPAGVIIKQVSRAGAPAPSLIGPDGPAFAMAGEPLLVEFGARVEDAGGKELWASNFGNETARPPLTLANEAIAAYKEPGKTDYLKEQPALAVNGATWKWGSGTVSVEASWGEAGATRFVAGLTDYLGTGTVPAGGKEVGRFTPAYFSTEITEAFACGSGIACPRRPVDPPDPAGATVPVGVVYSGQPFQARIVARNIQGDELGNYTGAWFRKITLSAVGPKAGVPPGTLAPLELTTGLSGTLVHTLPNPYSVATHRTGTWQAPAAIFLRAQAADGLVPRGVSSDRSPGLSYEDGVMVLSGRLQVANALGTDVLRTALALRAQFWSGAAWVTHAEYEDAGGAAATAAQFTACTHSLAGTTSPCNAALVGVSLPQDTSSAAPANVIIRRGTGVLWLRAPGKRTDSAALQGRSRTGSIGVRFPGWHWLPSTAGRVSFGGYRSRFIYQRELY